MSGLQAIAPGVHVVAAPQRYLGMELGTRMTVLELDGGLLVHSPVAVEPGLLKPLGDAGWVVAPNLFHHLYFGPWARAGFEAWAAPGLSDKRPDLHFDGILDSTRHPFGDEIEILPLRCFPTSNEVVFLHRPSRTLIVTDLVFNLPANASWFTRMMMRSVGGYPGCRTTVLERFGMKRELARAELETIAAWDFDRLLMAHGEVIETGGKAALLHAFKWLR